MSAIFRLAIAQIVKPSWWNDPPIAWQGNRTAQSRRAHRRADLVRLVKQFGRPVTISEIAEEMEVTVYSVRNQILPAVAAGELTRHVINGEIKFS